MFSVCSLILASNHFECNALKLDEAQGLGVGFFTLPFYQALTEIGQDISNHRDLGFNLMEPIIRNSKGGATRDNAVLVFPGSMLLLDALLF